MSMYIPTWKDTNGNTILRATLHSISSGDASVSAVDDTVYYATESLLNDSKKQQLSYIENLMVKRLKEVEYGLYTVSDKGDTFVVTMTPNILFSNHFSFERGKAITDTELRSLLEEQIVLEAEEAKNKIKRVHAFDVFTEVHITNEG